MSEIDLIEEVAKFLHNCSDNKWSEGADQPTNGGTVWTTRLTEEYRAELRRRAGVLIELVRSGS